MIFDSGLKIIKASGNMEIKYPVLYLQIISELNKKFDGEYSFLGKIDRIEDNSVILKDEYYIPKQEVTATSVEYLESPSEWDVVVHRHPFKGGGFSATDTEYINSNFKASLLISYNTITYAIFNIKTSDFIFQLEARPSLYIPIDPLKSIEGLENIKEKKRASPIIDYYNELYGRNWL